MLYDKLNYLKIGSGKNLVVFLHGWGGSAQSFYKVASAMQNSTCYLIDLYGFGKTPIPRVMDIYDYATQLYLFFVALNIKNFTLVCHSFGGRIGIILSSMYDIKIKKLVLVDSAGLKYKFNLLTKLKIFTYKLSKILTKLKLLPKSALKLFGSKDLQNAKSHLKITFIKVVNEHLNYLVKYINVPTLIVWGTHDRATPPYMAKWLGKHITHSRVVYYKAGHFSYVHNYQFIILLNNYIRS